MKIISITKDKLLLNSGITETNFGRMNYGELLSEAGLIAVSDNSEKGDYTFAFDKWSFDEVISMDNPEKGERTVSYTGNVPLENATVSDLTDLESENAFDNVIAVISALTQAAKLGEKIPENGAGGVLLFKNDKKTLILFMPEKLYNYSVQALPLEDQGTEQNLWKNDTLHELSETCFFRAALVYKLLTKRFPYSEIKTIERNADILDGKYTPLEMYIPSIPKDLSEAVNNALVLTPALLAQIELKKKNVVHLKPNADFPISDLRSLKSEWKSLGEEADKNAETEKVTEFLKKKDSSINTKRKIRRNRAVIIVCSILAVLVGLLILDTVKSKQTNYTSIGLTSEETLEAYFSGFSRIDTNMVDMLSTGKGTKGYSNIISQVFVITKQREAYLPENGMMTPAGYLVYSTDRQKSKDAGLFGITGLKIDGKVQDMVINVPKRKDKPVPLTKEKNVTLENGMTSVHKVNYYRFHTEGENNDIYIEYHTDTVTLTFMKDHWMLTNIETVAEDLTIDTDAFMEEYWSQLEFHNGNVKETLVTMKPRYPWLPTPNDVELEERYKVLEARKLAEMIGTFN